MVDSQSVPMVLVRNHRARRYILRLRPDGVARITVPRSGSQAEARRFAERNRDWLKHQLQKLAAQPKVRQPWRIGIEILFRGESVKIERGINGDAGFVRIGAEMIRVNDVDADLRASIERYLWNLAAKEFPPRVLELATLHQLPVRRVTVRNQCSRWGSCSRRGTISLNWRLIQAPEFVRDYLIFHELAHLREMNHSSRFWGEVERLCHEFRTAEQWLRQHSSLLRK
jgi:predicted metal-dependent hydrolase